MSQTYTPKGQLVKRAKQEKAAREWAIRELRAGRFPYEDSPVVLHRITGRSARIIAEAAMVVHAKPVRLLEA